jgi:hypothetical protein
MDTVTILLEVMPGAAVGEVAGPYPTGSLNRGAEAYTINLFEDALNCIVWTCAI